MAENKCPRCDREIQERFPDGIALFCGTCGKKTYRAAIDDRALIYVATPYKHSNEAIMIDRFNLAARLTGRLVECGYDAYSPIVHNRTLAIHCGLPHDLDFWKNFDRTMLSRSDLLLIVKLKGYARSGGIKWERAVAEELRIPFAHITRGEIERGLSHLVAENYEHPVMKIPEWSR